jgi:hypothetical protein
VDDSERSAADTDQGSTIRRFSAIVRCIRTIRRRTPNLCSTKMPRGVRQVCRNLSNGSENGGFCRPNSLRNISLVARDSRVVGPGLMRTPSLVDPSAAASGACALNALSA